MVMMIAVKKKPKRKKAPKRRRVRKIAAKKRAENPLRKYDGDFLAGWESAQRALKRNRNADLTAAARPWGTARKTHGSTWLQGFGAALGHARFGIEDDWAKRLGLY